MATKLDGEGALKKNFFAASIPKLLQGERLEIPTREHHLVHGEHQQQEVDQNTSTGDIEGLKRNHSKCRCTDF